MRKNWILNFNFRRVSFVTRHRKRRYRLHVAALKFDRTTETISISIFTWRGRMSKDFASPIYIPFKRYPRWNETDALKEKRAAKNKGERTHPPNAECEKGRETHIRAYTLTLSFSLSLSLNITPKNLSIRDFRGQNEASAACDRYCKSAGCGLCYGERHCFLFKEKVNRI